jgi:Uma2 family endonuclease
MIVALPFPATFDDLMKVEGKAELIGGRIVEYMASGRLPGRITKRITRALDDHVIGSGLPGEVFGDNLGYAIDPPLPNGRQSFNPDGSYYAGPVTNDASFIFDAPTFAVEVRSENDFGPAQDRAYADKRDDYFAAGTLVVWDVNYKTKTVAKYTPAGSTLFGAGDVADAEPAVPGWTMAVADIFAES